MMSRFADYWLVVGHDSLSLPQTQPSNSEGAINRRPSLSFSSTSTSTTSSSPGVVSIWSTTFFELSRSALTSRSIRSHKFRTAIGDVVEGSSRNQVHNVPISPPHQALASSIVTSDTHVPATPTPAKLHLFTEGMLPLSVNLEMVPGDGVAYLRLQLNVPKYQPTCESSFSRNLKSGFGAQLETICPAGTRSLSSVFTCVTQVWGTSFGTNHPSQTKGVYSTLKQEPMSYGSSMLCRKVSTIAQPSHTVQLPRHRTGGQLSCLGRQEAMVEIIGVLPELAVPSTSNEQLMIFNFPESALSSCQLLEPGVTLIHQDINFAGKTILCVTYTLNRQEQLPAAKLLGWERSPIPTGPALSRCC
ncbi:hypothetical protein DFH05DRAFT_1531287 [Lentinula detonsa]|uniref:Uncharacterized protein n=1 Tax=Lentinula detonsa TaxID=2804962 RepID=A0A9W8NPY3_9AGAR|nr:hypothetical protein DFH05DRAFT_1531287 [Lentinula detonsa]